MWSQTCALNFIENKINCKIYIWFFLKCELLYQHVYIHDSLKKKMLFDLSDAILGTACVWSSWNFCISQVEQIRISVLECFSNILHHALSNLDVQETVLVLKICVRWRLRSLQWPSFLSYSITCINTCWLFGFQFFLNLICKVNIGEFLSCKLMQLGNWCPISLWGNNCLKGKKKQDGNFILLLILCFIFCSVGELTIDCLDYKFLSNHTTWVVWEYFYRFQIKIITSTKAIGALSNLIL